MSLSHLKHIWCKPRAPHPAHQCMSGIYLLTVRKHRLLEDNVELWDAMTNDLLWQRKYCELCDRTYSPVSNKLVIAIISGGDNVGIVWDLTIGVITDAIRFTTKNLRKVSCMLSNSGTMLVAHGNTENCENFCKIWDLDSGSMSFSTKLLENPYVLFTGDDKLLITGQYKSNGAMRETATLHYVSSGYSWPSFRYDRQEISGVVTSMNGKLCALHGSQGLRVVTFNTRKATELFTTAQEVVDCCFGVDDNYIVGFTPMSYLTAWDIVNGTVTFTVLCLSNDRSFMECENMEFSPGLASVFLVERTSEGLTVHEHDAMLGSRKSTSNNIHPFRNASLCVSPVGNILL
jgi:hypothetical protein